MLKLKNTHFPKDFLFGVATSSYQTEGNNLNTDWWEWEQVSAGRENGPAEKSAGACNSYEEYQKDIDIAKSLNVNCFRLSIEWARIEPEMGKYDQDAISHYVRILEELKRNGFTVFLTLHHFTLPIWVKNNGGWENNDIVSHFKKYSEVCAKNFYTLVDFWGTINEPMVLIGEGYTNGHWPPNKSSKVSAFKAFVHILKAHTSGYISIKSIDKNAKVGIIQHTTQFTTEKPRLVDILVAKVLNFFSQDLIFKIINKHNDYLGVNYYTEYKINALKISQPNQGDKSDLHGWAVAPNGLYLILKNLTKYNKPIFITENGIATNDEQLRCRFIAGHLAAILKAKNEGTKVNGYMYWSLLDNYEWLQGYKMKFGIVGIDQFHNYERIVKNSAKCYAEICKSRELPRELYENFNDL